MIVPFVDLNKATTDIADRIAAKVNRVIERSNFILGEEVEAFEQEFAAFCQVPHAVGVDSGVSALELSLRALGVGPGDEVITVSHTFIATVSAIQFVGATPVLVDIDPVTYNMDVAAAECTITPRTKAILPVHLYGQPADMAPLAALAEQHGLALIEDACQAHGATYRGRRTGSLGDVGCFSFYPAKNLGAFGDAGAIVTKRADLAERLRVMRNYGQERKYHHLTLGYNRRLDTIQAAVLLVKLGHLEEANRSRAEVAATYTELLRELPLDLPRVAEDRDHVFHLFVVQTDARDRLRSRLAECGVGTGLHYPVPVHLQPACHGLGYVEGSLPITERVAKRVLSLPMFPNMEPTAITYVAECIHQFFDRVK